ncbi:hypothetical protein AB4254_08900 [Vibrio breoganii]
MTKNRDVYNNDIFPLLQRIALVCKQEDVSFFAACQTDLAFQVWAVNQPGENVLSKLALLQMVSETDNLDDLLVEIMECAREHGHNSKVLRAIGIPFEPKAKK